MSGISPNTHLSHCQILSKLSAGARGEVCLAQALAKLNQSNAENEKFIGFIKIDPFLKSLRDEPRFSEIVKKVGLPL